MQRAQPDGDQRIRAQPRLLGTGSWAGGGWLLSLRQ